MTPPHEMDPYHLRLGNIAQSWSYFEMHLNRALWEFANVEQWAGACITSQIISPAPRFRALIALVRLRGGSDAAIKKLNSMSASADAIARRRNRFIHDMAGLDPHGTYHRLEITADRKLAFVLQPTALADMDRLEADTVDLMKRFYDLIREILAELPAFPRKQFLESQGIHLDRPEGRDTVPQEAEPQPQL